MPLPRHPQRPGAAPVVSRAPTARRRTRRAVLPAAAITPPVEPVPVEASPPPQRRASLTGRAAILALAVCAVVLTLVYPLREYVAQRGQISALRAQNAAAASRVTALEQQHRRWQDPAYVRTQARQRLHYQLPGEKSYVVIPGSSPAAAKSAAPSLGRGPWYDRLWSSAEEAGSAVSR